MAASRPAASRSGPIPSRLDRDWPGARQILRIERLRELKDRCSRQVVYAITSIAPEAMDAEALLDLARAHWQIENRLFRVRDGTFAEDACRVRSGTPRSPRASARRYAHPKPAREAFAANPKAVHPPRHDVLGIALLLLANLL